MSNFPTNQYSFGLVKIAFKGHNYMKAVTP